MNAKVNPLTLSDADFLDQPEPEEEITSEESTDTTSDTTKETTEETTDGEELQKTEEDAAETEEEVDTSKTEEDEETKTTETSTEDTETKEEETQERKDTSEEETEETKETKTETDTTVDYKTEYEKLLTPFKANGKNIQVNSVDDAIHLMQMGANYTKKMAALKPNLRLMKMLENNELLDEEKLSYLIDLDKKNPEAVQKFIKESGIDPLDIDTDKDTDYTPNTYTVNDKEVDLDGVLDEIRDTPTFQRTIDIIGTKWDASSKKILIDTPNIIKVINEQIGNGIFDQITDVIDSERMLGRLAGLSDLEAYKQVGDAIQKRGGFKTTNSQTTEETTTTTSTNETQDDPKLKHKKRAASTTRSKSSGSKKEEKYNPLAMSDSDFEKVASDDFL